MGFHVDTDHSTEDGWDADWYLLTRDVLTERPGTDRALARFELSLERDGDERTYRVENVAPAFDAEHRDHLYRLEKEVDRHARTLDMEAVYDDADWWSYDPATEALRYDEEGSVELVRFHEEQLLGEDIYRAAEVEAERDTRPPWNPRGPWHVTGSMHRIVASPVEAFRVIEAETGVDAAGYVDGVVPGRFNW